MCEGLLQLTHRGVHIVSARWGFAHLLQHCCSEHLEAMCPRRKHFLQRKGFGIEGRTLNIMEAMLTLSGSFFSNVSKTVSERMSGHPFIGSLFTSVTSCSARAAFSSSSLSEIGTPKITPLSWVFEIGREQDTCLFAITVRLRRVFC